MIEDSPEDDAHDIICEQIFYGSSLAKSVIGTPSSLNNVKSATIREYLKRYYTRENTVIAVSGNFDEDETCEILDRLFSPLPSGFADTNQNLADYEPRFRTKVKDIEQSHICMASKSVKMDDDRYYSLVLLNNILGGSMSSRLFQNIREQKGLAYSVYSMNSSFKEDGFFNIYAAVSHDNVSKAIGAILEELEKLRANGVKQDELAIAKEQMKSQYIFSQENVNGRMFAIGKYCLLLNKVYTPEEIIEKMDAIRMEDIDEAARLLTDPASYSGVLLGRKHLSMRKMMGV
jgi:predicted Zn-dependent peptidase